MALYKCVLLSAFKALILPVEYVQMGFQEFLQKCEILEFDFDPKAYPAGPHACPGHAEVQGMQHASLDL